MSEEILAIRGWVQNAVKGEEKKAIKQMHNKRFMNDYERGKVQGAILAYQHVLVETSPTCAWKAPLNAFDAWATDVSENSPLSIGAAMEIYNFCEKNNILKMPDLIEIVMHFGKQGYSRFDITNLLEQEAIKQGMLKTPHKWGRKK